MGKSSAPEAPNYAAAAEATALGNLRNTLLQAGLNRPTEINPFGARTWGLRPGADPNNPQPGDWVLHDSLSPDQQNLLDRRETIQLGLAGAGQSGLGRLQQMFSSGLDTSRLPGRSNVNLPGSVQALQADRRKAEDTAYRMATRRFGEQFGREEDALRTRLSNTGLVEGSEAYNRALEDFGERKDEAYAGAGDRAYQMGGMEQSRMLSDLVSATGAQDARRGAALQEEAFLRQLPLNELNQLLAGTVSGGQQGGPGGQGFAQAGGAPGPDYMNAATQQYGAASDAANFQNAQRGQTLSTAGTLASALMMAFSDKRLKSNIKKVGEDPRGFGLYEYDIFDRRERGVLAQEVREVMPEAVGRDHNTGYLTVNYGMLGVPHGDAV